jgi:hypothetical protein
MPQAGKLYHHYSSPDTVCTVVKVEHFEDFFHCQRARVHYLLEGKVTSTWIDEGDYAWSDVWVEVTGA